MGISSPSRWRAALLGAVAITMVAPISAAQAANPDTLAEQAVAAKVQAKLLAADPTDKVTFWVRFGAKPNLVAAEAKTTKAERGAAVRTAKIATADSSQSGVRALLTSEQADFQTFWISNAIKVTGQAKLFTEIAVRPEVVAIEADVPVVLPKPIVEPKANASVNAVEWNVDRINAPQVWAQFGRGEGIVVANIDTGVQFDHPAVANQYRGRSADGSLDHNYNWYDPSNSCPTAAPCDNNDHGTHTMGTMVGDDGTNQIGVAPGAKWIAAKGCESSSCSTASLMAAGQWVVAPTDLSGANPRPDLAPDVVNNSWGGGGFDPFYSDIVNTWVSSGIFPAFSNGNSGPSCNTSGSPGMDVASYSSGAFDVNNAIASFSSRGAGENGDIKPNLASPGVNVRSSIRNGGFANFSGTSMASPHTAATVALMWSASPALRGDIAATRGVLDATSIDVNDTSCGGTAADNNVFGEGRLDAFAAVSNSPRGPVGSASGTITSSAGALAGATVAVQGPISRTAVSGADGTYRFQTLSVGDYTVTVSKFGYQTFTGAVTVLEGQTAVRDAVLTAAASATITGTVSSTAGPAVGATVALVGTPVTTTTDANGHYSFTAPTGDYQLTVSSPYQCADAVTQALSITADATVDVTLPQRADSFGYTCAASTVAYPTLTTAVALTGDDAAKAIDLPFPIPLYGQVYNTASLSTNGNIAFAAGSATQSNVSLPSTSAPNGALYPFWDDLVVDTGGAIYSGVVGAAPHRWFAIEWRDVRRFGSTTERLSFVAMINEDGSVVYRYKDIAGTGNEAGAAATIGLENGAGTVAFQYGYNSAVLSDGLGIGFLSNRHGVVRGTVTDANDGLPVAGATVALTSGGTSIGSATSDAAGAWLAQVPAGDVTATVTANSYATATKAVTVAGGSVAIADTALGTARVVATPATLKVIAPAAQTRTRTIQVSNTGALATTVDLAEVGGDVPWLSATLGATSLAPGASTTLTVTVDSTGLAAGSVSDAALQLTSTSGRTPQLSVPVKLIVPGFQSALDSGSRSSHVDALGDTWAADRAAAAGVCGYLGSTSTVKTSRTIAGTTDSARFADARQNMYEYRCDGVANGVYTVELGFAELSNTRPNKRVFDVMLEDTVVLPNLDIALAVGSYTALERTFTVTVTDGVLDIRFITHSGFGKPLVNSVRVTQRPDLG